MRTKGETMEDNDYEGAILAGYSAPTDEQRAEAERIAKFNRHLDTCWECDYEHGILCDRALAI